MTPGTVDADIYERCLMRIGVFHHAVGGSEEILGEITREIHNIADSFTLTPEQRADRLQQLGDNKIRQVQEETALEEKQAELFGLTVPNQSWREEIAEAESFWLSAEALQRCVTAYLSGVAETDGDFLLGDKPLKTLRLGQKIRARLFDDFRNQPRSTDPVARQWEMWLPSRFSPLLIWRIEMSLRIYSSEMRRTTAASCSKTSRCEGRWGGLCQDIFPSGTT